MVNSLLISASSRRRCRVLRRYQPITRADREVLLVGSTPATGSGWRLFRDTSHNLRAAGGTALMRHALASKTCKLGFNIGSVARRRGRKQMASRRYCVGPAGSYHNGCHHNGCLSLKDLPDWRWQDISTHLKCNGWPCRHAPELGRSDQFQQGHWMT
jgi:hypothetical protein